MLLEEKKLRKNGNFYAKSVLDKIDVGFWCNSTYSKIKI